MTPGLGENQDTASKRIDSWKKGYQKRQPDLVINNISRKYSGMVIEFKTSKCMGVVSQSQKDLLERYEENGYKCILSNDYDLIIKEVHDYSKNIVIKCKQCGKIFKSRDSLIIHGIVHTPTMLRSMD